MKLDMQKIYIDSRFRTANSKSETDFNVELPRSFNVPDGVVAHIDDIVIPVSWSTIDERNQNCHVRMYCGGTIAPDKYTFAPANYDGYQFAAEMELNLNYTATTFGGAITFGCIYDRDENMFSVSVSDERLDSLKISAPFKMEFLTDEAISTGSDPNTINTIIRNRVQTFITEADMYTCYLDLFQTRNLYLTSSALCSYDTVSNFGMDTIVKKIPCTAGYNKMIFLSSGSTLDGLDVSKRTLRFLDFKLVDSSFRTVPLRGNHFSFSIVFSQKR
jgi:hypothetical protein